jgi:hypothetical protein
MRRRVATRLMLCGLFVAVAFAPLHVSAGTADGNGWARFGHFAPSADAVDVLIDGAPFASNLSFKDVSEYREVPAGAHTFELRAGSDPDGPALLSIATNVADGGAITVAAVTTRDGIAPQVFDDEVLVPQPGEALVRFIHAAPDSAAVDISVVGGPQLARAVPYPEATEYGDVSPGTYDVVVSDAGTGLPLLEVDGWSIEAGVQASIVFVVGSDGALDVAPLVDAVALPVAPTGGVQSGYGGTAAQPFAPRSADGARSTLPVTIAAAAVLTFARVALRRGEARR